MEKDWGKGEMDLQGKKRWNLKIKTCGDEEEAGWIRKDRLSD